MVGMSKQLISAPYPPEDAGLPVTMTLAAHYEGIREAQAAAWDEGQRAWEDELLGKAAGTNPYRSQQ